MRERGAEVSPLKIAVWRWCAQNLGRFLFILLGEKKKIPVTVYILNVDQQRGK